LGANAILAVSIAASKIFAAQMNTDLFRYIAKISSNQILKIPKTMFNFIEGAKHADNNLSIQEFLVIFDQETFKENYRFASELFHKLKKVLVDNNLGTGVGHEGGFAPTLASDEEALRILSSLGNIKIALDLAGVVPQNLSVDTIVNQYPVVSLEDPAGEDDLSIWEDLTRKFSQKIMLVGDDIFATNIERLKMGTEKHIGNAVIVKPNQIGTVSETINFVKLSKQSNYKVIVSHRSGETEDTFIADFAVGVNADFVKFGAPSRGERISKYNRLLRIEESING